jgi:hypothetical protein
MYLQKTQHFKRLSEAFPNNYAWMRQIFPCARSISADYACWSRHNTIHQINISPTFFFVVENLVETKIKDI